MLMKKFFTLAALALCALTINAQTTISFSEVKAAGSLNGQTITSTLDGFSLTVTDTKDKVTVDESGARFGTAESNTPLWHGRKQHTLRISLEIRR